LIELGDEGENVSMELSESLAAFRKYLQDAELEALFYEKDDFRTGKKRELKVLLFISRVIMLSVICARSQESTA